MPKVIFSKALIFFLLLIVGSTCISYAQYSTEIFDKNRSRRDFDRYDLDKYFEEQQNISSESDLNDTIKNKIKVTPEELRKLGASEELIEQLLELNNMEDSLQVTKDELKRRKMEKDLGKSIDSLSIDDLQKLINYQKEELIEKALALPESYVYGHDFFRNSTLKVLYDDSRDIRPPKNYTLGQGDEVTITIWGDIDYSRGFKIDVEGSINPELVGKIFLRGIGYDDAKDLIKKRFAGVYDLSDSQMEVTLSFSRIISANFVGELFSPGTYRFPAMTSVFNALVALDGPNQIGSVRNIYITRAGETIKKLDIYEYLTNPNSREDFFLEENDYVVVPPLGKVVNISGEVRRPHNYEVLETEGLKAVIRYAGGLDPEAFTRNINIKRYQDNREILIDVNLDSLRLANADFTLENGDSIFVYRIPREIRNYVQVTGAVAVPGKYEVKKGDRVTDVLYKSEGVLEDADLGRAYVIRLKEDMSKRIIPFNLGEVIENERSLENVELQHLDTIQVVSRVDFRQDFSIRVFGAVRQPGEYQYAEGLTLVDLLYLSGGMKKEAANNRIEISRLVTYTDRETGKVGSERIIIKRASIDPDLSVDRSSESFELKPYDHVFIRTSRDFEEQQTIKLYGEVTYPGEYALTSKEEKISSVIERAGGMTKYAFRSGAKLFRQEDSIGYVLLDLDRAFNKPEKSKFNYILFDGDSIFIPKFKNIVTLEGAIRHFDLDSIPRISVPYEGRRRADHYIKKYGAGFGRYAKKARTYVQQPNGEIDRAKYRFFFRKYPKVENGATVFVDITDKKRNERFRQERKKGRDWSYAFDSFTAKAATVLTILLLVQQARN